MSDVYYAPYDYELDANPHPVWKRLRDASSLYELKAQAREGLALLRRNV